MTLRVGRRYPTLLGLALLPLIAPPAEAVAAPFQQGTRRVDSEHRGSEVWGTLPLLPWDTSALDAEGPSPLGREWDLRRRGERGDERVVEIRRINLTLDRLGRVIDRMVIEGRVRRVLLAEEHSGRWRERYTWERFAMGRGEPGGSAEPTEVEAVRGLSYVEAPDRESGLAPAADFSRIGDPLARTLFSALTLDAISWDAIVLRLRDAVGDSVGIGERSYAEPAAGAESLTGADSTGGQGSYRMGEMRVSVAGLTRWSGEPALLIWFSLDGNVVEQTIETEQLSLATEGTEYFRGVATVSLMDGRVVAGELWGPVMSRTELGVGGAPRSETPAAAVLQSVTLREVER